MIALGNENSHGIIQGKNTGENGTVSEGKQHEGMLAPVTTFTAAANVAVVWMQLAAAIYAELRNPITLSPCVFLKCGLTLSGNKTLLAV